MKKQQKVAFFLISITIFIVFLVFSFNIFSIQINDEKKIEEIQKQIHYQTNTQREKNGVAKLIYNEDLEEIAKSHSKDMFERNYFYYETPEGCDPFCRYQKINFTCPPDSKIQSAENIYKWIFYASTLLQSPEQIGKETVKSWMSSTLHKENILSSLSTYEGIGVIITLNEVYITQDFC